MRITLKPDEDVAAKLKAEARRSGRPFRYVVNDVLRCSLAAKSARSTRPRFTVAARDLGELRPGLSLDKMADLIEHIEGPLYR